MEFTFDKLAQISHTLFEVATEGLLIANKQGVIVLINPRIESLFGYEKPELIGNKVEMLLPPNIREKHEGHRAGYSKAPTKKVMGKGRDLYGLHKNGMNVPVEISLNHFSFDNQLFVMALITDISDRKASELEILKAKEQLEIKVKERTKELEANIEKQKIAEQNIQKAYEHEKELNELKSRFVSMASHEFKTPLANILTSATLIDKYVSEEEQEKRNRHVVKIKKSVNTLNAILNDFLSLDKVESGMLDLNIESFDFIELCNESIDQLDLLLKDNQSIKLETQQDSILVMLDRNALKHIVANLLSNGIKYSESTIIVKINKTENELQFSIADTGIGIPEEEQKNIFGKFFRAKNSLNIQGTGLGLHIIKYYVELLHGKITFISHEGTGTTFYITIPLN